MDAWFVPGTFSAFHSWMQGEELQWTKKKVHGLAAIYAGLSSLVVLGLVGSFSLSAPWVLIAFLPVMLALQAGGILLGLAAGMAYLYIVWLALIKLWLVCSRGMRVALGCCFVLAIITMWSVKAYERRIDWTSRGLNPSRPGFVPEAVILAGTFDYWIDDRALHNQIKSGSGMFEIRMNGYEHYYAKRWRGHKWEVGSWVQRRISIPGYSYSLSRSKLGHTTRGSGGWLNAEADAVLLGRRLWTTNGFVGATDLVYTNAHGQAETFEKIVQHGRFGIPGVIRFTEGSERRETYRVRRVEFQHSPTKDWFHDIKRYRFDRSGMRGARIEEPGPF